MRKREFVGRKLSVGYLLFGAACALSIGVWWSSSDRFTEVQAIQVKRNIIINNKTQTLHITKAELEGRNLRLGVKNGSRKNLDWFRVSFGNNESIEADFAFADPPILAPGEIYEDIYPIESSSADVNITVVSVLFEDRTADGDVAFAKAMKDKRTGQKTQLKRLLPLLQKVANLPHINTAAALDDLEVEVSATSDENDPAIPEARRLGLRNARERLLNEVKKIRQLRDRDNSRDVRPDLLLVKERYEKILLKLEDDAF